MRMPKSKLTLYTSALMSASLPLSVLAQLPVGDGGAPATLIKASAFDGQVSATVTPEMAELSVAGQSVVIPPASEGGEEESEAPLPGLGDDQPDGSGGESLPLDPASLGGGGSGENPVLTATSAVNEAAAQVVNGAVAFGDASTDLVDATARVIDGEQDPGTLPGMVLNLAQVASENQPDGGGLTGMEPENPASELPDGGGSEASGGDASAGAEATAEITAQISGAAPAQGGEGESDTPALPVPSGGDSPAPATSTFVGPVTQTLDDSMAEAGDSVLTQLMLYTELANTLAMAAQEPEESEPAEESQAGSEDEGSETEEPAEESQADSEGQGAEPAEPGEPGEPAEPAQPAEPA